MADIILACPHCGNRVTVSEFADPAQMTCRQCGRPFAQLRGPNPRFDTPEPQEPPAGPDDAGIEDEPPMDTIIARVQPRAPRRRVTYQMVCWMVFAGLAFLTALVRFGGLLTPDALDALKTYGPFAVLAMHLFVSARAFQDAVLTGVLCLLVPGYSLFYAFWTMDDYMARAVFGALLVAAGADTLAVIVRVAPLILPAMYNFLSEGL
jgi:hypothetical protein